MAGKEIITRRSLPHWYVPGAAHFITFRLFGSLPRHALDDLRKMKEDLLKKGMRANSDCHYRQTIHKQLFAHYDQLLEQDRSVVWLKDPRIAALVRSSLYFHHGSKYYLQAYCIMSNHVHVLLQPIELMSPVPAEVTSIGEQEDAKGPLEKITHSLKSYTAHEANKLLNRQGSFWQKEGSSGECVF